MAVGTVADGSALSKATASLSQPQAVDPHQFPGEEAIHSPADSPTTSLTAEPAQPPVGVSQLSVSPDTAAAQQARFATVQHHAEQQPRASTPPHIKTHHHCTTTDGWRLHLVRTRAARSSSTAGTAEATAVGNVCVFPARNTPPGPRRHPVILCPGLGSSGAYTFDLSPVVSLADHLASQGWDVWTVELRGNGQSDRPRLFVRSRWWTIDDYVTKDLPSVLQYVRHISGARQVHVVGHSMGGMILTRLLALGGEPAAAVASATVVGSGCFLRGSWWQVLQHTLWLARFLWVVPAGATLRAYSPLALGRAGLPLVDELYFWPPNTEPVLARAVLARNFSAISSGVILQFGSGFGPRGLCTADGKEPYADASRLARVDTPVLFICGDRDRMCPPKGAAATCALFTGSRCARFVEMGPKYGTRDHYGHFDILMGRRVEQEVFPLLTSWLDEQDGGREGGGGDGFEGHRDVAPTPGEMGQQAAVAAAAAAATSEHRFGGGGDDVVKAPVLRSKL